MPIVVKDFTWRETEEEVELSLPLKGAKPSGVDVFSTDEYIKVNYPPFLFELQLFAPVVEEQCSVRIGNGMVEFRLVKRNPGLWTRLRAPEGEDESSMVEKRSEAIAHAHKKAAEEGEARAKKKREEEQFAIKQQMKLEEEERARIERTKQQERDKAMEELDKWKSEKTEAVRDQARHSTLGPRISDDIWPGKTAPSAPPPRKGGNIVIHFTPRQFTTAARESTAQQEEEWLAKMAAARRIQPPKTADESPNERNPEFLKDKGVTFFKAGNYEAAINIFSEAINLNKNLPHLYSNRAACYLSIGDNESCIKDCSIALELLFPVVPSNYAARTKVFVRRGTAYANVGELDLALQDYDGAKKLSPQDERIRQDYERIKQALLAEH